MSIFSSSLFKIGKVAHEGVAVIKGRVTALELDRFLFATVPLVERNRDNAG